MELLLGYRGLEFLITQDLLEAAARNFLTGKRLVEWIFQQRQRLKVTDRVASAAVGNELPGDEIVDLFLQHRYDLMRGIPEDVLGRIAGNPSS